MFFNLVAQSRTADMVGLTKGDWIMILMIGTLVVGTMIGYMIGVTRK